MTAPSPHVHLTRNHGRNRRILVMTGDGITTSALLRG
jgi:hypothetical protein